MKRFYSVMAMALMLTSTVVAQNSYKKIWDNAISGSKHTTKVLAKGQKITAVESTRKSPMKVGDSQRSLTACDGTYNFATGFVASNGDSTMTAVGFTPEELTAYVGGEITTIHLPINDSDNTLRAYGWVAIDDLSEVVQQAQVAEIEEGWVDVVLPKSVTVDGEHTIYIGASFVTDPNAEMALPICLNTKAVAKDNGCLLGVTFTDNPTYWEDLGYLTWEDYSDAGYGTTAVEAIVDGVTVLDKDARISSASLLYTNISLDNDESATFSVMNNGNEAISSFDMEVYVNDKLADTQTFTCNLSLGQTFSSYITFAHGLTETTLAAEVKLKVVNINGAGDDDDMSNNTATAGSFNGYAKMYDRNVVVEEGTGTWCGYCVYGIWGMETMKKKYPNSFVGLAIHASDEMDCGYDDYDYYLWQYAGFDGYPSCLIDRSYLDYPDPETLEAYYELERGFKAPAKFEDAHAYWDGDDLHVEGSVVFGYSQSAPTVYAVCTVLVEDSVGPYTQRNYLSGESENAGGWEDKESYVSTIYNDVVRGMYPDYYGSLMEDVYTQGFEEGVPVEFSYSFDTSTKVNDYEYDEDENIVAVTRDRYQNKDHLRVALLLCEQNTTGAVLNAVKLPIFANAEAVESIKDNTQAPTEYYSIEGMRLNNPTKGLVIEKSNGKTIKRILK